MKTWQVQEAKMKLSELIENAMTLGPQKITKRGKDAVIVLSVDEYSKLKKPKDTLIDFFKKAPKFNLEDNRQTDFGRNVKI